MVSGMSGFFLTGLNWLMSLYSIMSSSPSSSPSLLLRDPLLLWEALLPLPLRPEDVAAAVLLLEAGGGGGRFRGDSVTSELLSFPLVWPLPPLLW